MSAPLCLHFTTTLWSMRSRSCIPRACSTVPTLQDNRTVPALPNFQKNLIWMVQEISRFLSPVWMKKSEPFCVIYICSWLLTRRWGMELDFLQFIMGMICQTIQNTLHILCLVQPLKNSHLSIKYEIIVNQKWKMSRSSASSECTQNKQVH